MMPVFLPLACYAALPPACASGDRFPRSELGFLTHLSRHLPTRLPGSASGHENPPPKSVFQFVPSKLSNSPNIF